MTTNLAIQSIDQTIAFVEEELRSLRRAKQTLLAAQADLEVEKITEPVRRVTRRKTSKRRPALTGRAAKVATILAESPKPMTNVEIQKALNGKGDRPSMSVTTATLSYLTRTRRIRRVGRGLYTPMRSGKVTSNGKTKTKAKV